MTRVPVERRRTAWDVVLGVLLIVAGIVILGHAVLATVVSVVLIGWLIFFGGVVTLISAFFHRNDGGFWPALLGGALLLVLGVFFLRNPGAAALTLTLLAGTLFLIAGITRLVAGFRDTRYRWPLLLGGIVSTVLGLIVLFNLLEATLALLGILVGVEALVDGIVLLLLGRVRPVQVE